MAATGAARARGGRIARRGLASAGGRRPTARLGRRGRLAVGLGRCFRLGLFGLTGLVRFHGHGYFSPMTMVPAIRSCQPRRRPSNRIQMTPREEDGDADHEADQPQEGLAHGDRLARLLVDDAKAERHHRQRLAVARPEEREVADVDDQPGEGGDDEDQALEGVAKKGAEEDQHDPDGADDEADEQLVDDVGDQAQAGLPSWGSLGDGGCASWGGGAAASWGGGGPSVGCWGGGVGSIRIRAPSSSAHPSSGPPGGPGQAGIESTPMCGCRTAGTRRLPSGCW